LNSDGDGIILGIGRQHRQYGPDRCRGISHSDQYIDALDVPHMRRGNRRRSTS
jgi:hypothetical protein